MSQKFDFTGKVAAVTGGGSGIGESIVTAFARQGATVHLLDVHEEGANKVLKALSAEGLSVFFHQVDISKGAAVAKAFEKIMAQNQRLDVLVNNAGIAHVGNILNTREEDLDRLYQVNVKGVFHCTREAVAIMKTQPEGGAILNMASVAAVVGVADRLAYSMTKGAVLTMTYSIAKDCLPFRIRCNAISPGRVHTPFVDGFLVKNYPGKEQEMFEKLAKTQPIGRMGKPEEVADLALFLCSDEASFITGANFPIDGGFISLNS
jgi:NAD(P)-dependent dehydrogenase (short-subunit alcohol dehydrogenase family)